MLNMAEKMVKASTYTYSKLQAVANATSGDKKNANVSLAIMTTYLCLRTLDKNLALQSDNEQ